MRDSLFALIVGLISILFMDEMAALYGPDIKPWVGLCGLCCLIGALVMIFEVRGERRSQSIQP